MIPRIWRNLEEKYNLVGSRCTECKKLIFPGREVCPQCSSTSLEPYQFIGRGKIVTFTVIRTPISDPEGELHEIPSRTVPYILAIVALEEGPRLTTEVVDCSPEDVEIDAPVQMVFRKLSERSAKGVIQYGYKCRLA